MMIGRNILKVINITNALLYYFFDGITENFQIKITLFKVPKDGLVSKS